MIVSKHIFGPVTAIYYLVEDVLSLMIVPSDMADAVRTSKLELADSLVQISEPGETSGIPYSGGLTLHNSMSSLELRFQEQYVEQHGAENMVVTILKGKNGEKCTHKVWGSDRGYVHCSVSVKNDGSEPITLYSLPSFSINGLTPFADGSAPNSLRMHRFSSYWSAEGRHESYSLEELNLEPSWSKWAPKVERISQVGTMPVRGYFPFLAIEDTCEKVVWAAELEWAGSWQMEIYRQKDNVILTGGLADYDVGHWLKVLRQGEEITTPSAVITCVRGDIDFACETLLRAQEDALVVVNEFEENLCPLFNEYCDTWSNPTIESISAELESIKELPLGYFVIDAGWYGSKESWNECTGDWLPNPHKFPDGMLPIAEKIKSYGFVPGIWFEAEVASEMSNCFTEHPEYFVKRDGKVIIRNQRAFLNMADDRVQEFLKENIIDYLKDNEFRYIKIDYNDHIGLGFEGYESLGEAIRKSVYGTYQFFDNLRHSIPELVIENCSSGGHRLEPSMMKRSSMASFSDAHECTDIPLIAADLQRLIIARQSQIWAVIKKDDSERRIVYSLVNTLLGRMCLSGNVSALNSDQLETVRKGVEFYNHAAPIIKSGSSRCLRKGVSAYGNPQGWQVVTRVSQSNDFILLVFSIFEIGENETTLTVENPFFKDMVIADSYGETGYEVVLQEDVLTVRVNGSFSGVGVILKK